MSGSVQSTGVPYHRMPRLRAAPFGDRMDRVSNPYMLLATRVHEHASFLSVAETRRRSFTCAFHLEITDSRSRNAFVPGQDKFHWTTLVLKPVEMEVHVHFEVSCTFPLTEADGEPRGRGDCMVVVHRRHSRKTVCATHRHKNAEDRSADPMQRSERVHEIRMDGETRSHEDPCRTVIRSRLEDERPRSTQPDLVIRHLVD